MSRAVEAYAAGDTEWHSRLPPTLSDLERLLGEQDVYSPPLEAP